MDAHEDEARICNMSANLEIYSRNFLTSFELSSTLSRLDTGARRALQILSTISPPIPKSKKVDGHLIIAQQSGKHSSHGSLISSMHESQDTLIGQGVQSNDRWQYAAKKSNLR